MRYMEGSRTFSSHHSPQLSVTDPHTVEDASQGALRGEDATELPAENPPVL